MGSPTSVLPSPVVVGCYENRQEDSGARMRSDSLRRHRLVLSAPTASSCGLVAIGVARSSGAEARIAPQWSRPVGTARYRVGARDERDISRRAACAPTAHRRAVVTTSPGVVQPDHGGHVCVVGLDTFPSNDHVGSTRRDLDAEQALVSARCGAQGRPTRASPRGEHQTAWPDHCRLPQGGRCLSERLSSSESPQFTTTPGRGPEFGSRLGGPLRWRLGGAATIGPTKFELAPVSDEGIQKFEPTTGVWHGVRVTSRTGGP